MNQSFELIQPLYYGLETLHEAVVRSAHYDNGSDNRDESLKQRLETFYSALVLCLKSAAEQNIPKKSVHFYKYWWNEEAEILKKNSIATHREWVGNGRLHAGLIYEKKRKAKYLYKTFLKQQHKNEISDVSNICTKP